MGTTGKRSQEEEDERLARALQAELDKEGGGGRERPQAAFVCHGGAQPEPGRPFQLRQALRS
jgi:hypothetical protein